MSTYRTTSRLSKPTGREKIPSGAIAYLRARNRMRIFSLVWREFQSSGLTQAELAARLGKGTDRVCKLLGAPGNWTLDTVSDLLFAIKAGVPDYTVSYPLEAPKRNDVLRHWVTQDVSDDEQDSENFPRSQTRTDFTGVQWLG